MDFYLFFFCPPLGARNSSIFMAKITNIRQVYQEELANPMPLEIDQKKREINSYHHNHYYATTKVKK